MENKIENASSPHYAFAAKYDAVHAREYYEKHDRGLARQLSNWREHALARKALKLAGNPASVLDLPCGTGRFWDLLTEREDRRILVADNSQHMIDTGLRLRPPEITRQIAESHCCSAFATGLPDAAVESVFCFRLLHHIGKSEDRVRMLRELSRVAAKSVIVSLWVDGNFKAWRRRKIEERRAARRDEAEQNRFLVPAGQAEAEFRQAGLRVVGYSDFLPGYAMWRAYVLIKENRLDRAA